MLVYRNMKVMICNHCIRHVLIQRTKQQLNLSDNKFAFSLSNTTKLTARVYISLQK
jgi:hypothetical protein